MFIFFLKYVDLKFVKNSGTLFYWLRKLYVNYSHVITLRLLISVRTTLR